MTTADSLIVTIAVHPDQPMRNMPVWPAGVRTKAWSTLIVMFSNSTHGMPLAVRTIPSAEVVTWREHRLRLAGFDEGLSRLLAADADVDLHELLNLVDRGCPPPLAARILGGQVAIVGSDRVDPGPRRPPAVKPNRDG